MSPEATHIHRPPKPIPPSTPPNEPQRTATSTHPIENDACHSPAPTTHSPRHPSSSFPRLLRSALRNPDQLTAMISNYSTSYNAVNVGIVLPVLKYSLSTRNADPNGSRDANDAPLRGSDERDSAVASSLLAGMIFGQMLGGCLGDLLGRRNAMLFVMLLQIGGSLGAALFVGGEDESELLERLAVWRFVLGVEAGGVYPLAAVMSAENERDGGVGSRRGRGGYLPASDEDRDRDFRSSDSVANTAQNEAEEAASEIQSFQRVALTFSMQGLGFVTVPLLAYPMLALRWDSDSIWRLLLGLGALPGFGVLYLRLFGTKRLQRRNGGETDDGLDEPKLCRSLDGSFELAPPTSEEESSGERTESGAGASFGSAVSTLFADIVEGDPSSHVKEDHQVALVDNSHLDNRGFDDTNTTTNLPQEFHLDNETIPIQPKSLWSSIKSEPHLAKKLAGTAGTWFLFDVLFYGNTLFEPVVLEAAFGSKEDAEDAYALLLMAVRDSLAISFLSLPGYFVTVLSIGSRTCVCTSVRCRSARCSATCPPVRQTPAFVQMQGFLLMFLLYLLIGIYWTSLSNLQYLLLVLYAGTFFFANYGPNSTTFLLPSVTYSRECRSTLNGISAAAGKFGALVGAGAFEPAADRWGESVVMVVCAVVSLFGFAFTKVCVGGCTKE